MAHCPPSAPPPPLEPSHRTRGPLSRNVQPLSHATPHVKRMSLSQMASLRSMERIRTCSSTRATSTRRASGCAPRSRNLPARALAIARTLGAFYSSPLAQRGRDGEGRDVKSGRRTAEAPLRWPTKLSCACRSAQSLAEGEAVEFRLTTDPKTGKVKAVDVTGPDGAYVQGAPREPRYDDEY